MCAYRGVRNVGFRKTLGTYLMDDPIWFLSNKKSLLGLVWFKPVLYNIYFLDIGYKKSHRLLFMRSQVYQKQNVFSDKKKSFRLRTIIQWMFPYQ